MSGGRFEVVRRLSLHPVLKFADLPSGFSFREKLCVGLAQFAFVSVFVALSQTNAIYVRTSAPRS